MKNQYANPDMLGDDEVDSVINEESTEAKDPAEEALEGEEKKKSSVSISA
jgi:hypothetical protein